MIYDSEREIRSIVYNLSMQNVNDTDLEDSIDHGRLVSMIAGKFAAFLGLDKKTSEELINSAVIHDVGKLMLSKSIYGRDKNSMHVEEVRHMRMHAKLGAEMLGKCDYPDDIVLTVYHHHECYDGSGYPDNLRGDDIPYTARILKVCDSFAALVSDRPYRKGFDKETALGMMIEDNKDYDIRIFLQFMNMTREDDFEEVMNLANEINGKHRY